MIGSNGAWRVHARGLSEIHEVLSKGRIKLQKRIESNLISMSNYLDSLKSAFAFTRFYLLA